jgi:DNA helicase-2/ATP-dependent DNA helicase PcrA
VRLSITFWKLERDLREFTGENGEGFPTALDEIQKLRAVPYQQVKAIRRYVDGYSPFETKHGVKGAEFENVLVVIGRGWNLYNFREMLELSGQATVPSGRAEAFERNRNLFYVACSRPKRRLALLFTQELSEDAIATLKRWFLPTTIFEAPL